MLFETFLFYLLPHTPSQLLPIDDFLLFLLHPFWPYKIVTENMLVGNTRLSGIFEAQPGVSQNPPTVRNIIPPHGLLARGREQAMGVFPADRSLMVPASF
jgi:hypothetical protein